MSSKNPHEKLRFAASVAARAAWLAESAHANANTAQADIAVSDTAARSAELECANSKLFEYEASVIALTAERVSLYEKIDSLSAEIVAYKAELLNAARNFDSVNSDDAARGAEAHSA
jgi:hypothetical protein